MRSYNNISHIRLKVLRPNNTFKKNAGYEQHLINILYIIIDIIHGTTSGVSRQGRPRGGEATEWHPREPQAPEGKESATLKFRTAVELKCWGH